MLLQTLRYVFIKMKNLICMTKISLSYLLQFEFFFICIYKCILFIKNPMLLIIERLIKWNNNPKKKFKNNLRVIIYCCFIIMSQFLTVKIKLYNELQDGCDEISSCLIHFYCYFSINAASKQRHQ